MRIPPEVYPLKRTINPRLVHLVCAYLADRGFDIEACSRRFGQSFLQPLDADGTISFSDFLELLDYASRTLNDDALALKIAQQLPFVSTGLHHYIINNAPVLGTAVEAAAEFTGLVTNSYTTGYEQSGGFAWINFTFRGDTGPLTQFIGMQLTALAVRARRLVEDPALRMRVEFEHPEPRSIAAFQDILGQDLKFSAPRTRAGFHREDLCRPIPDADPQLFEELLKCGRIMLQLRQHEKDVVARVSYLIADRLATGEATPECICKELDIRERTLQRELAAASTTFTKVVEDTRKRMSRHFLLDTDLPLTEIAYRLGYSELSAFSRAARCWFGETPTSIRKNRHRGEA